MKVATMKYQSPLLTGSVTDVDGGDTGIGYGGGGSGPARSPQHRSLWDDDVCDE